MSQNVKIVKGIVGRFYEGSIVPASVYGAECQRLLGLGVIALTDETVNVDDLGDIGPPPAVAPSGAPSKGVVPESDHRKALAEIDRCRRQLDQQHRQLLDRADELSAREHKIDALTNENVELKDALKVANEKIAELEAAVAAKGDKANKNK